MTGDENRQPDPRTTDMQLPIIPKNLVEFATEVLNLQYQILTPDGPLSVYPDGMTDHDLDDSAQRIADSDDPAEQRTEIRKILGEQRAAAKKARLLATMFLTCAERIIALYPMVGIQQPEQAPK